VSPRLVGRVAVVSPHLDDAVLSLGAAIAASARNGATVFVVTVLGGEERSGEEAGEWDRAAGFRSAGEAAGARAREDDRACEIVGAVPRRLPFWDKRYARGGGREEVATAVEEAVADADTILLPGYPLQNEDHSWVTELVLERRHPAETIGFYAEQPYAAWSHASPRSLVGDERPWTVLDAAPPDQLVKLRACRAYKSQVPLLGGTRTLLGILAYEARHGGESVSWLRAGSTLN
jgi:LmbE family N-acetylglucosaminyl deacetylase